VAAILLAGGVATFVATGVLPVLIGFGTMGALLLFAGERAQVQVSSFGLKSVPPFGRSRSYPWSDIGGFVAHRIPGGRGGWVVYVDVADRWFGLPATRRGGFSARSQAAVERLVEKLNAEFERARGYR
jgi:hypothetical protein